MLQEANAEYTVFVKKYKMTQHSVSYRIIYAR